MAKKTRDFDGMRERRLRAAEMFERGESQAEVARVLRVSRQSVMRWHDTWREDGREGLEGAGRAGRMPRVTAEQLAEIEKELLRGPLAHGHRTDMWTLPRITHLIEKLTGVSYHPGHVWKLLRGLGWSRQRPTTRAKERDEEAIARWVRTTWPTVKKTPDGSAPRSSSSTKAASPSAPRSGAPGRRGAARRS